MACTSPYHRSRALNVTLQWAAAGCSASTIFVFRGPNREHPRCKNREGARDHMAIASARKGNRRREKKPQEEKNDCAKKADSIRHQASAISIQTQQSSGSACFTAPSGVQVRWGLLFPSRENGEPQPRHSRYRGVHGAKQNLLCTPISSLPHGYLDHKRQEWILHHRLQPRVGKKNPHSSSALGWRSAAVKTRRSVEDFATCT